MITKIDWKCVAGYIVVIGVIALVMYMICYQKPSAMSKIINQSEDYEQSSYMPFAIDKAPKDEPDCKQVANMCRIQNGDTSDAYCRCMDEMGCGRNWCHCLTVVNKCANESKTRKEFCRCIGRSDCTDMVPCEQDTNVDCGYITTKCKQYYPENVRACSMYHGCKPSSDPICINCQNMYAADIFSMGACQICRGCQADQRLYGDRQLQGKLPKCKEIPEFIPPKKKLSPKEQEMADYLKINKQCGFADQFGYGKEKTSFDDEAEKYCYCCTGMVKYGNKYDSCNCAGVDCVNTEGTQSLCSNFMKRYKINFKDVPEANVNLSDKQKGAVRPK